MLFESTLLYFFSKLSKFLSKLTKVPKGELVSYKAPRFVVTVPHPAAIASIAAMQLVSGQILGWAKILSLQPHLRKNSNNEILPIYKKHSHYNGLIESYGKNINEAVRNRDQIALESFKYMQKKTKGLSF